MRYVEVPVAGPGLTRYLEALAPTRLNGGTKLVRFQALDVDDRADWFRTSSLVYAFETFRSLFTSEAAIRAMPEVLASASFQYGEPPIFHGVMSGALTLEGELAGMLSRGGAYARFTGSNAKAKRIAAGAAHELLQDRYEDFRVFFSDEPWTPWFFDIAWDATWLLVDDANRQVTVLVTTDTD